MRILNPIYDVVFKYLLEDMEIAQGLLSNIIGEEIIDILVQPQETSTTSERYGVAILRFDFRAIIKTKTGEHKKILIELQKGKFPEDIMRFRKYLGENYRKPDSMKRDGVSQKEALPITTIYFLGFPLRNVPTTVLKVNREYIDLITHQKIEAKEAFIEQLTHDSFIIQISRLGEEERTELEHLLTVFNQTHITDDRKILEITEQEVGNNELLRKMTSRLRKGATEEEMLKKIEAEEEVDEALEKYIRKNEKLVEKIDVLTDENEGLKQELERLRKQMDNNNKA